jgi:hypothetical protein
MYLKDVAMVTFSMQTIALVEFVRKKARERNVGTYLLLACIFQMVLVIELQFRSYMKHLQEPI